ncbi:Orn/Lys/Arg decarboxylase N-terminal domain-containing protein [Ottowia sp.]|uniref:Orn/Lys/Arg family decarboxylase n=1 Tax=Ottowia sp. TaxID=1898956 RepID=UPI003A86282C
MLENKFIPIRMRVLIVDDELAAETAEGRSARSLVRDIEAHNMEVIQAFSADDGMAVFMSDAAIHAVMLDWTLGDDDAQTHEKALTLLRYIRGRNDRIPVFLMAERGEATALPIDVMQMTDEYVWTLEDTGAFVSGRVEAAARRYVEQVLPPMAKALGQFARTHEYSWHTPGHTGGTAFLKSPVGRLFYDYFGENLLRSDLSISVGELGSLLDHSGPIGESEKYTARVFGASRTYSVTNGTSTSNRVVMMAAVTQGQIALCDRNCHKSIEHGLLLTDAIPQYLVPLRNRLGIIGPIHPDHFKPKAIKDGIAANPLVKDKSSHKPVYGVITNSTYDGLCYNAKEVEALLDPTLDRLHWDEAWYGYARFNPIYKDRHAMRGDPKDHQGPTIFATHSTHKLLAALSQASFLHVRDGRQAIAHERFNESFMMHASTSPLYTILASNDVTSAMMDGRGGQTLTNESIEEAVAFRQTIGRAQAKLAKQGNWFFKTWNAELVTVPGSKRRVPFHEAPPEFLATDASAWVMHPGDSWHGFDTLPDDYCMLDPIKVSVLTPGMNDDGTLAQTGIPATLLTAYLDQQGIQVEKTTDFTILFLFSIGITKGKWGTLVNALLDFKRDYDADAPLAQVLPQLVAGHPAHYAKLGLRGLADQMFEQLKTSHQTQAMSKAFSTLPTPVMTPAAAYRQLVLGQVESLPLDQLAGRVLATSVVPYPPGIPMLMPGEQAGAENGPYLTYLRALRDWDQRFPGFSHDTHGIEVRDGQQFVQCLRHS